LRTAGVGLCRDTIVVRPGGHQILLGDRAGKPIELFTTAATR
jgi:hypothetical protein